MRKRIVTAALAFATAVAGLLGTAAPASAATQYDMTIRSAATGMCLTPQSRSSEAGVPIDHKNCNAEKKHR